MARIAVTDEELDRLAPDLALIIAAVARVREVATDDVPPMTHAVSLTNVTRADVLIDCLPVEDVLAAAPAVEENKFSASRESLPTIRSRNVVGQRLALHGIG